MITTPLSDWRSPAQGPTPGLREAAPIAMTGRTSQNPIHPRPEEECP